MKTQKGITLIALIITIIVMLILVGVSVSVALNTGLFKTAQGAAKNTEGARANEIKLSGGQVTIGDVTYPSLEDAAKDVNGVKLPEGMEMSTDGKIIFGGEEFDSVTAAKASQKYYEDAFYGEVAPLSSENYTMSGTRITEITADASSTVKIPYGVTAVEFSEGQVIPDKLIIPPTASTISTAAYGGEDLTTLITSPGQEQVTVKSVNFSDIIISETIEDIDISEGLGLYNLVSIKIDKENPNFSNGGDETGNFVYTKDLKTLLFACNFADTTNLSGKCTRIAPWTDCVINSYAEELDFSSTNVTNIEGGAINNPAGMRIIVKKGTTVGAFESHITIEEVE